MFVIIFIVAVLVLLMSSARNNKKVRKMHQRRIRKQRQAQALATIERWTEELKAKKRGK